MKTILSEMTFELSIFHEHPSVDKIDDIKDRITVLFQDAQDSLSDNTMQYFLSEVTDDSGDAWLDEDNRWWSMIRIRFRVQDPCDAKLNE